MKFIGKQLGMFVSTCVANFFRLLIDAPKFVNFLSGVTVDFEALPLAMVYD